MFVSPEKTVIFNSYVKLPVIHMDIFCRTLQKPSGPTCPVPSRQVILAPDQSGSPVKTTGINTWENGTNLCLTGFKPILSKKTMDIVRVDLGKQRVLYKQMNVSPSGNCEKLSNIGIQPAA